MELNGKGPQFAESDKSISISSGTQHTQNASSLVTKDNEQPTFDIEQVQLQFNLGHSLQKLCVQNDKMYLVLGTLVYKIDLANPSQVKRYQLPSSTKVLGSWLHPNGLHLIIQLSDLACYYLHDSYSSFKLLSRFKNLNIKQIAFPTDATNSLKESTGDFLVGTVEGAIYLASIKSHIPSVQDNKRDDKYLKLVFKHSLQSTLCGLEFTNNNLQINAVINNIIHSWDCFDTSYSELLRVFKVPAKQTPISTDFNSIITSNGKLYIVVNLSSNEIQSNDLEIQLSQSDKMGSEIALSQNIANVLITPHHLVSVSHSNENLLIFNKLALASSEPTILNLKNFLAAGETLIGTTADYGSQTYWLYTNNSIYEFIIENESISVWYNYYKMGKYEEALRFLNDNNGDLSGSTSLKKDIVLIKQGYDYLQKGGFGLECSSSVSFNDENEDSDVLILEDLIKLQIKGIRILANLSEPFEKICLMLLNLQYHSKSDTQANVSASLEVSDGNLLNIISEKLLVEYLLTKYDMAKRIQRNKIRIIVLSSWIVQVLLRIIYRLEYKADALSGPTYASESMSPEKKKKWIQKNLEEVNETLKQFLDSNYKQLDRATIYQIIVELNVPSKLLYYAELIEDYEFILNYYIDTNNWKDAVKTLGKLYSTGTQESKEIIYRTSTVVLVNCPKLTIDTWLKFNEDIGYEHFLPAILTYNKKAHTIPLLENYSLQFLLKLIYDKGIRNSQINTYYASLLITYPGTSDAVKKHTSKQIIKFLNHVKLESLANSTRKSTYDPHFVLRLCLSFRKFQPAVLILLNDMTLFDQALKLALDNELTDLGEFVLRKYDEYIANDSEMPTSNSHSEGYHELTFGNAENKDSEGFARQEDINYVGKIKLEEESYSSRKQLWIRFSKYLIQRVCDGKEIPFLEKEEDEDEEDDAEEIDSISTSDKTSLKSVTDEIVGSMFSSKEGFSKINATNLKKLNKVLKYILNLSSTSNTMGVLSLKDLLPLFPESIMINNFKDEIVKSLNQYNNKISQLSMEMKESLAITSSLKQKLKDSTKLQFKSKVYSVIQPGDSCQLCNLLLINKNFIFFPNCRHGFHKECLMRHNFKLKGNYMFKKIFQNFRKNPSDINKKELDEILIKECILCNDANINLIDTSLIDLERDQEELIEWEL